MSKLLIKCYSKFLLIRYLEFINIKNMTKNKEFMIILKPNWVNKKKNQIKWAEHDNKKNDFQLSCVGIKGG